MENLTLIKPEKVQNIINKFCYTIGMIPSSYKVSLTYEEQIIAIGHYLEETVIPALNNNAEAVAELQTLFVQLKDYVENYFDDLNIQTEIDNKLDEMAKDGTLAKIINEDLFNELNKKVEKVTEFPNFFIAPFFSGYGKTNERLLRFYISLDGVHFNATNFTAKNIYEEYATDLSLQYNSLDKTFYLAMTSFDETQDCLIFTSKNLVDWEKHQINLGFLKPHNELGRWAPDLFVDSDGTLYLCLSVEYKKIDETLYFEQILFKCNNLENLTFTRIGNILLNDKTENSNYIDGSFAKYNNNYYFIVKHEGNKNIELYQTTTIENLSSYALLNDSVTLPEMKIEAPSITFTDTTCNIYTENYLDYHGYNMQQCKLRDFPNISKNMILLKTLMDNISDENKEKYDARHGNVLWITDENAKSQILNSGNIGLNSYNAIYRKDRTLYFKGFYGNETERMLLYPNVAWNMADLEGNVNISILNPYNERFIIFYFGNNKFRLAINKIDGVQINSILNVGTSLLNSFSIFDIYTKSFLTKQQFLDIANITNIQGTSGEITAFTGNIRGDICQYQANIKCNAINDSLETIANINTNLIPLTLAIGIPREKEIKIVLNDQGQFQANFAECEVGKVYPVQFIYLMR
ncbi:MAG: family 43 glycosylhydrolase [Candidatus Onthovivens sp.]|nr:family 43 glycosylhydrolase [Bacilli bacterium]